MWPAGTGVMERPSPFPFNIIVYRKSNSYRMEKIYLQLGVFVSLLNFTLEKPKRMLTWKKNLPGYILLVWSYQMLYRCRQVWTSRTLPYNVYNKSEKMENEEANRVLNWSRWGLPGLINIVQKHLPHFVHRHCGINRTTESQFAHNIGKSPNMQLIGVSY